MFIALLFSTGLWSQEIDSATVRKLNTYQFGGVYKSSISANLGGVTGFGGFTYEYLMGPHWQVEAGIGFWSLGVGFDYYPWVVKREKSRLKVSLRNSWFYPVSANLLFHSAGIGMTHFFKERLNLAFDIGVSYIHLIDELQSYDFVLDDAKGAWPVYPHFNVKLGYRFSLKMMKRVKELEAEN